VDEGGQEASRSKSVVAHEVGVQVVGCLEKRVSRMEDRVVQGLCKMGFRSRIMWY